MAVTTIMTRQAKLLASFLAGGLLVSAFGLSHGEAQTRTEHIFEDWRVVCAEAPASETDSRCHMVQTLIHNESRRELLRWMIISDGENEPVHVLSAPLGVSLRPGIQLAFGDEDVASLSYSLCDRRWCHARQPLSEELRSLMASGEPVRVIYANRRGQSLRMEATMRGFSEAVAYMEEQNAS